MRLDSMPPRSLTTPRDIAHAFPSGSGISDRSCKCRSGAPPGMLVSAAELLIGAALFDRVYELRDVATEAELGQTRFLVLVR